MAPLEGECKVTFTPNANIHAADFFEAEKGEELMDKVCKIEEKLSQKKNPVMYVFVNSGLNMDAGKIAAQVAHAQEELFTEIHHIGGELFEHHIDCMLQNPRTVVILEAKNTDELYKINSYLESCHIITGIYVDEGSSDGEYLLEPTALACEYLDKEDERTKKIFSLFNKYEYCDKKFVEQYIKLRNCENKLENIKYCCGFDTRPIIGMFKPRKVLKWIREQFNETE